MISFCFLGTGAAKPSLERSSSGILISTEKATILLDCGENIQIQMIKARRKLMKIQLIIISHLHGDHFFGLPGLLQTMDLLKRKEEITIVGPKNLLKFINLVTEITNPINYPIRFKSIEDNHEYIHEDLEIRHVKVEHSIDTYATLIRKKFETGKFLPNKAIKLQIPKGELWGKLKQGKNVTLDDGVLVNPLDVTEKPPPPMSIVYSSDTKPCDNIRDLSKDAFVLIHDSTYSTDDSEIAEIAFHSTIKDACEIAEIANVKNLFLTHISSRYKDSKSLQEEARKYFKKSYLVNDLDHYLIRINKATNQLILEKK